MTWRIALLVLMLLLPAHSEAAAYHLEAAQASQELLHRLSGGHE